MILYALYNFETDEFISKESGYEREHGGSFSWEDYTPTKDRSKIFSSEHLSEIERIAKRIGTRQNMVYQDPTGKFDIVTLGVEVKRIY